MSASGDDLGPIKPLLDVLSKKVNSTEAPKDFGRGPSPFAKQHDIMCPCDELIAIIAPQLMSIDSRVHAITRVSRSYCFIS